ncbi:MAG: LPS export ABC transporter periplasmic protein LptC [Spirochaetales bacterium]
MSVDRLRLVLGSLALLLIILGCSIDYETGRLSSELSEDTPDTVLYNLEQRIIRDGYERFRIVAARVETFSGRQVRQLYEVSFVEFDSEGNTLTEGTADYGELETDTENFVMNGSLRFYSAAEDAWLTAERLAWDAESRLLQSEAEELVSIDRGDGTFVQGRGFRADMARNRLEFDRGVSGTIPLEGSGEP